MGGACNDGRGMGRVNVFSPDCFLWFILHCEWEELAMIGVAWTGLMYSVQIADFLWFILHCEWEELAMMGVAWTGLMWHGQG